MLFEIDDAGIGCIYGGLAIVINDFKNPQYFYIQPSEYQHDKYDKKNIYNLVTEFLVNSLKQYPTKEVRLNVCRGMIFNSSCRILKSLGYIVNRVKIEGQTQELVESYFNEKLLEHGIEMASYESLLERLRINRDFKNAKSFWKPVKEIAFNK